MISPKKYICLVCGNEEIHSTNHFSEIYCNCVKCKSMGLECIEENAIQARNALEKVSAKVVLYHYDISKEAQKQAYKALSKELKEKGYKKFRVISEFVSEIAFRHRVKSLEGIVEISEPNTFPDQFISNIGRIHNWFERACQNKDIKGGYYIIH